MGGMDDLNTRYNTRAIHISQRTPHVNTPHTISHLTSPSHQTPTPNTPQYTNQKQIDYTLEGRNADEFRNNFKDVPWVKVPKVYWQYSSSEVLVLEYCPGVKINDGAAIDAMGHDRQLLARRAVESYLQQV